MKKIFILNLLILFSFAILFSQETLDFYIKGVDDGIKSNREKDYKEALIDAKRKALEKAGVEIKSETIVQNFKLIEDLVETKSEGLILPGMIIEDLGYNENGYYQVFIIGKIKTPGETVLDKKLRYAESLYERQKTTEAREELDNIILNSDSDELVEQALYCKIIWKLSANRDETIEKLKAFYPNSIYLKKVDEHIAKTAKVWLYCGKTNINFQKKTSTFAFMGLEKYKGVRLCVYLIDNSNRCLLYDSPDYKKGYSVYFNKSYNLIFGFTTYGSPPYEEYVKGSENVKSFTKTFTRKTPRYNKSIKNIEFSFSIDKYLNIKNVDFKTNYK